MVDAIPTLAWCSLADGSVEFFNQRWHDYTGLSPQEAYRWGWKVTIHPEDLEKSMEKWRALLSSGEAGGLQARPRRPAWGNPLIPFPDEALGGAPARSAACCWIN